VELMSQGAFRAGTFVTHRYPLERINEAFQQKLEHPEDTFKVQVVMEP
jgi:Zn-dependent alcohol dehydrogenase